MCILSINTSKLQGYSGSLAVMSIHDPKLHSVYKHVHNCIVYRCPEMTLIVSVYEYQCCILVQCSVFWNICKCTSHQYFVQFSGISIINSYQSSGISIIAQYQCFVLEQFSVFCNICNCTVSMFLIFDI